MTGDPSGLAKDVTIPVVSMTPADVKTALAVRANLTVDNHRRHRRGALRCAALHRH
eukprot:COSAG05_NODE_580_length_8553_cov_197.460934_6_plen_56_part_00